MSKWKPIETAPQDHDVLLAVTGGWVGEARLELSLHDEVWKWVWASGAELHQNHKPIGWMHLPEPPQ